MGVAIAAAAAIAAGGAIYAGQQSKKAGEKAANQLGQFETFDPIRPDAPETLDWRRIANEALSFNLGNAPLRNQLARQTNTFNTKEAQRAYGSMQPYFRQLQDQIGRNALSFSKGELPADVVGSIGRAAAQRGLQSGIGMGSRGGAEGTALGNLNLRNLGLTSLQLSQYGTNLAMNANQQARALSPNLFDPANLMLTPQQGIGYENLNVSTRNEAARYWNQLQNQAAMQNTSLANRANQMGAEARLGGDLAQAQQIAAAASSIGSAVGGMGSGGAGGFGTATNIGAIGAGYYTPGGYRAGMGYHPIA